MTSADIITDVLSEVNRSDLSRPQVLGYMNGRQNDIVNFDDWSFMEETANSPTVAQQQSYSIPTDYKSELQMWLVDSGTNIKTPLVKWVGSEAEKNYAQPNFYAKPFAYWIWQDAYFLYPIPDIVYTLWLKYYAYLPALTDTASVQNELVQYYPKLLKFGATADAFHWAQQPDKAGEWETKYKEQFQLLIRRQGKRLHSNYQAMLKLRIH